MRLRFATIGILGILLLSTWARGGAAQELGQTADAPAYQNEALGVSLKTLPSDTQVLEDQYLFDSYGFTVVDPQGWIVLRVGWRHRDTATQMEQRVKELLEGYSGVELHPQPIRIGPYKGIRIAGVPGIDPVVYVYLAVDEKLYEIIYPESSVIRGDVLLRELHFGPASRTLADLHLIRAEDALYDPPPFSSPSLPKGPAGSSEEMLSPENRDSVTIEPLAAPGCADWPTNMFLQTPWTSTANGDSGSGYPQGWSKAGPSYYGEGYHQYCNRTNGLNDHHALDFRLKTWDTVLPPAPGRVLFAGWTSGGYSTLGRVVIIDLGSGYWSMSAHLRSINVSVGQNVTANTVIGYAGGSGNGQDGYWSTHLHQGLYLNARLNTTTGGIYAGQSVEPRNVRYFGNGGGAYPSISQYQWMSW